MATPVNVSALYVLNAAVAEVLGLAPSPPLDVNFMSAGGMLRISYASALTEEQKANIVKSANDKIKEDLLVSSLPAIPSAPAQSADLRTGQAIAVFVKQFVQNEAKGEVDFRFIAGQPAATTLAAAAGPPRVKKPAAAAAAGAEPVSPEAAKPDPNKQSKLKKGASPVAASAGSAPAAAAWKVGVRSPTQQQADEIVNSIVLPAIARAHAAAGIQLTAEQQARFAAAFASDTVDALQSSLTMFQAQTYTRAVEENKQQSGVPLAHLL